VALVLHSTVPGADGYVVSGSGTWQGSCSTVLGVNQCSIRFPQTPDEPICDFTIRATRDGQPGTPSRTFCVPGIG
jgi:hypothetical protein